MVDHLKVDLQTGNSLRTILNLNRAFLLRHIKISVLHRDNSHRPVPLHLIQLRFVHRVPTTVKAAQIAGGDFIPTFLLELVPWNPLLKQLSTTVLAPVILLLFLQGCQ